MENEVKIKILRELIRKAYFQKGLSQENYSLGEEVINRLEKEVI